MNKSMVVGAFGFLALAASVSTSAFALDGDFDVAGDLTNIQDGQDSQDVQNLEPFFPGRAVTLPCDSINDQTNYCETGLGRVSEVRLLSQASGSPCILNSTYGISGSQVWVTRGCRGTFEAIAGGGYPPPPRRVDQIRCESVNDRTTYCRAGGYIRSVSVAQQLSGSPCIGNSTFGTDGRSVWVTRGCRAVFNIFR